MAWNCVQWAWKVTEYSGLKSAEAKMLNAIADQSDEEGVCRFRPPESSQYVYFSSAYLARKCGCSRQRAEILLKCLHAYGLIFIEPCYPGTNNPLRKFTLNISIVPEEFQLPEVYCRSRHGSSRIMLSPQEATAFRNEVSKAFNHEELDYFVQWIVPALKLIEHRSKNQLRCQVPIQAFQEKVASVEDRILKVAQAMISPHITHIRTWVNKSPLPPYNAFKSNTRRDDHLDSAFTH